MAAAIGNRCIMMMTPCARMSTAHGCRRKNTRMKSLSRVVWSEGMYLGPHHFQAQNRYFEDSIEFSTASLWFRPYGFNGYELNGEALGNGTLSPVHARFAIQPITVE